MKTLMTMFDPEWRSDPYELYREMRESDRIFWDEWLQTWVVLGYDEVCGFLGDSRMSSSRITGFYERLPAHAQRDLEPLANALRDMMVFTDAPRHARLRRLARAGFTPKYVRQIRSAVEHVADELLARVDEGTVFDIVHDYAIPLTTGTIAAITGLRADAMYLLDDWQGLTHEFFVQSDAQIERIRLLREMFEIDMVARRNGTANDVFSQIIAPEIAGGDYTDDEIYANFLLLIDAGLSTTTYLIANAVHALIKHPDQLALLRADLSLVPDAVQELIRYDNSVQYTTRIALCDIEMAGQHIRSGQSVTLVLAAANRDPEKYTEPDRLDLCRKEGRNLSFGHGSHYCLGAALAIAETEVAIHSFLSHTREIKMEHDGLRWLDSINFRFLKQLPVQLTLRDCARDKVRGG